MVTAEALLSPTTPFSFTSFRTVWMFLEAKLLDKCRILLRWQQGFKGGGCWGQTNSNLCGICITVKELPSRMPSSSSPSIGR